MLHNIFSKSTTDDDKKKVLPKIIADIHEKNSMVLAELSTSKETIMEIRPLKIGDYMVADFCIERKTVSDLVSSIMTKRIFKQIKDLKAYQKRLLIIEGDHQDLYNNKKINPNMIRGFIISIISRHEIPIIFTRDSFDTSRYLMTLAKKQEKINSPKSFHQKIPSSPLEQKLYILQSFPGIGPKKSIALLEKFKTLINIFTARSEDLEPLLKKKSENFKNLLDL